MTQNFVTAKCACINDGAILSADAIRCMRTEILPVEVVLFTLFKAGAAAVFIMVFKKN